MDRIAQLITRADLLRRKIYASIPFEDRLATLWVKISLDTVETLGRAIGAEFLLRGVQDMPDPGPHWKPESRNPALTLPSGYMRDFASGLYGLLMKKFRDPSVADDAIQMYLARVTTSGEIKPMKRSQAESYVRDGVVKQALSIIRSKRRHETESLSDRGPEDEGQELIESLEDPNALKGIQREISPRVWKLWMEYLASHLHEDIPMFIALSMQGYENEEIIGHPGKGKPGMLPHYRSPVSGPNTYLKHVYKIPEVSKKFFKTLHEEAPHPV